MALHRDTYSMQTAAKLIGIGPNKLFRFLRSKKVLDQNNMPYQRYIDRGYLKVEIGHWEHDIVGTRFYGRPFVTAQGIEWLQRLINNNEATHDRHQ